MHNEKLVHFYSVNNLHSSLLSRLTDLENDEGELSHPFGFKMRSSETVWSSEINETIQQIDALDDQASEGHLKNQENKFTTIGRNLIRLFEEFRLKSDPLRHFKVLKETKSNIENTRNFKRAAPSVTSRNINKHNMWASPLCYGLSPGVKSEKSNQKRVKFSHKPIFDLGVE
ncbi:MAG TPA: hypothetical protein VLD38_08710 [Nitrosopumilaceae archaeon]|nr:hypothetical protein [Nitrosopumilaceae archaeon]